MHERWATRPLKDVVGLQRGHDLPARLRRAGSVPVVSSGGRSGWHNESISDGPGVVLGRATNLGKPYWVEGPYWPLNTTLYVRDFKGNDPRFVFNLFETLDLTGFDSGSVQPMLNRNFIANVPVRLPPLEEQQRIAGVLGAFDDLVEVNQEIRTKLDRKGIAIIEDMVLRQPDLDFITLGGAARVIETGRRPHGGVRGISEGVPSIGAESIDGLGVFDFSKTKFVPADFAAQMRVGVLESRDVLIYKDGGKPGDFRPHVGMYGDGFPFTRMTINEHVYRVRAASPLTEPYLYFWLSTETSIAAMRRLGTGAAIPGLNSTALKSIPVAIPPTNIQQRLFPALEAFVGESLAAASEARRLAKARDELLPLLLSGQVQVKDVAA